MTNAEAVKQGLVFVAMCPDRTSGSRTVGFPTNRAAASVALARHTEHCPLERHEIRNVRAR